MNPVWEQQRTLDPTHLSTVNTCMESASRTTNKPNSHCEYTRSIDHEPHIRFVMKAEREGLTPPLYNSGSEKSTAEDPGGKPHEMEDEDPELIRKRKELKAIEEKIMYKKAAIALKTVNPFVKKTTTTSPGLCCDVQSPDFKGEILRDRVNAILYRQHPPNSQRSKAQSRVGQRDGMNSLSPRQVDHPLKRRVNSLLRRRCPDPHVMPTNSEVLDVLSPLPPTQSFITPPKEENGVNKGFLRFLNVLNEGVDLNILSRIVNDDSGVIASPDEMLNTKLYVVETNSDVVSNTKCQTNNSGANSLILNSVSSGERKTVSQERSCNDGCSLLIEEMQTNERGPSLASRSQSKSPPAEVKKEDQTKEKTKKDEQQEQLQNILKTLGFSLEADEMSRLADRTQERLYGKKPSGNQEPDCQDGDSHKRDEYSSSFFPMSSPSKSVFSSPNLHRKSHKRAKTSHNGSDGRDVYQDQEDSQSHQTDPSPAQPTASSQSSSLAHLEDIPYHNGMHGSPAHFDSSYIQGESLPSEQSFIGFTYPQNTPQHFPYPVHSKWACLNPDLSMSEGQTGLVKGPRYLTPIESSVKKKNNQKETFKEQTPNHE